jgi:sec-independent protein translocase protein TatA
MPGGWEWIVILVVALLIFGKRLPEVARSIGKALTQFRKGMEDIKSDVQTAVYESEREYDERKKLEPPKTEPPKPETEGPYESDDTERYGVEYDEDNEIEDKGEKDGETESKEPAQPDAKPAESPPAQEVESHQDENPPD